jgi:prepilin-type N-terminal cleavage/methylation domain-containing protein
MKSRALRRGGFTLVELSVSAAILVIALTMAMAGFVYVIRGTRQSTVQDELDIDVQIAMESLKKNLRLTSLNMMYFYPGSNGPYTAVSFPMARDDDRDGAVDLDPGTGRIIWDKQVVYHVWSGVPNQLRMTTFDPRNSGLTAAQRQEQINSVVANGNGSSTHESAGARTEVVFANLFSWTLSPNAATYDGYAATLGREAGVVLGTIPLAPGSHTFKFAVMGKNSSSSGRCIGIDSLFMSPSYGRREGEAQWPVTAQSGATASREYMAGGSWDNNLHLYFPSTAVGHYMTLTMANDRWEETCFRQTGESHDNTTVLFDQSLTPYDFVVKLDGKGTNWFARTQTGDTNGIAANESLGCAVRVMLKGEEMPAGNWLSYDGGRCSVAFRAGASAGDNLRIRDAFIAECASSSSNTMDAAAGTVRRLLFSGANGVTVQGGTMTWSDALIYTIRKEKSYFVTYLVGTGASEGNAWKWSDLVAPTQPSSYIIPASALPGASDAEDATWSSKGSAFPTNSIFGVRWLATSYPTNGVYVSQVFDTALSAADFTEMTWNSDVPAGTTLGMRVRSGNSNDLSDAGSWVTVAAPGAIDPGDKRYVQVSAQLKPDAAGLSTPRLKDFTVKWTGETRAVDVGGTFTKGPDYGIFQLTVDGLQLKRGVVVYLKIYEATLGYSGNRTITSELTSEIVPRNSGK